MNEFLREDQTQIAQMITPGSSVLDLGCGDGDFLHYLVESKKVRGVGLEINQDRIFKCLDKGLNVIHANLDSGLAMFDQNSFDYVILNETLQVLHNPIPLLKEMLRVGKHCIVGISNFGYWKIRLDLLLRGRMPMTESLPYEWHDTPNIHLCTLKDFEIACKQNGITIVNRVFLEKPPEMVNVNNNSENSVALKGVFKSGYNLFACFGVYLINSEQK
jgi:methionine biosynthesis protein MetW